MRTKRTWTTCVLATLVAVFGYPRNNENVLERLPPAPRLAAYRRDRANHIAGYMGRLHLDAARGSLDLRQQYP